MEGGTDDTRNEDKLLPDISENADIDSLAEEVTIVFDENEGSVKGAVSPLILPTLPTDESTDRKTLPTGVSTARKTLPTGVKTTRKALPNKASTTRKLLPTGVSTAKKALPTGAGTARKTVTYLRTPRKYKLPRKRYILAPLIFEHRHGNIYSRHWMSRVFMRRPKITMLKSEANFIRLCKMTNLVCTSVLHEVLKSYMEKLYPPKTLKQFLHWIKKKLISYAATDKLISSRWKQLFPDKDTDVALHDFGPALTYWFLCHVCNYRRPSDRIWSWKPAADDVSEVADIIRIRDFRNFVVNATTLMLFDEEFQRKTNEITEVVMRLCGDQRGQELLGDVDALHNEPTKVPEREECLEDLTKWAKETGDRKTDKIAPAKHAWDIVKECKDLTRRFLKRYRKPQVFVKTKAVDKALEKLLWNGLVIIKGNTGEGKTTAAVAIMCSMFDEDEVLFITKPDHWKYVDNKTVGCMFIDDMFGSMYFDAQQLAAWEEKFEQMYNTCIKAKKRKSGYLIISMRKHVFDYCSEKLSKYKLFSTENVVEFNSADLLYSEKRAMLSKHIVADWKTRVEVDKLSKIHTSKLGYPQCCALYISQDVYLDAGSHFFEYPIEIMHDELDRLYTGNTYGYLALVVMMFQPGGVLFLDKLQRFSDETFRTQFLDLANVCHITINENLPSQCLLALVNDLVPYVYYYEDISCFSFVHESIMEIMMSSFVERHPQHILETCALQFIMDYATTKEKTNTSRDQIFAMRITKEFFWLLAQSFEHYINQGYASQIAMHKAFRDPQFLDFFFDYLSQQEGRDYVLLAEDHEKQEGVNNRKVGLLYSAIDQDKPNSALVRAILVSGAHKKYNTPWGYEEVESSFHAAVRKGHYDTYWLLSRQGLDIPDVFLMEEEYMASERIVKDLLNKRPWSSEQKGVTLVRAARITGEHNYNIVSLLIKEGVHVSSIRAGTTALCEAVKAGVLNTVLLLLENGASVHERDLTEQTPLHHACDWNHIEIVKILLKKGADIGAADGNGLSPFLVTAGWGRGAIMDLLLTPKIKTIAMDDQQNNVLHICGACGRANILKTLLNRFPQEMQNLLIARNSYGWTPLDFSIRCGHFEATKALINSIVKNTSLKPDKKTFIHMRFNIVRLEDIDFREKHLCRFLDENADKASFRMPRCKWFIQSSGKEEYENVRLHVNKHEDKLRSVSAKT